MKQVCSRPRRVKRAPDWRLLVLILGALALLSVLGSCGKSKPAATQPSQSNDQGYTLTTEPAQTLPGRVLQRAEGVGCQENLKQLREMIMMAKDENENGSYPASLEQLSGAEKIIYCPVCHKEYQYDPTTGRVWCTFPGHESY